jgi:hypothetical protein
MDGAEGETALNAPNVKQIIQRYLSRGKKQLKGR